jgi:crotonobetainyl-CoA:carnitine CoA-transferase CaiB-like acyl-CoA transferase
MKNNMLKDLKVVELASVLAGPSVGMFFSELGAEVIKIENKSTQGDVTRSWKLSSENQASNISAYFSAVNWGKKHLLLDLKNKEDLQQTIDHIRTADILITNFKTGDDIKYGLSPESLFALNSRLIYGRISGFGENNPRPAFDVVLQAEAGFMSMNGTPDSGPLKMPLAMIDVLAAHQLKEGILLGLLDREKTGKGAVVSVSLYDAAISSLINQASNYLMEKAIPQRIGSLHPNIAPYGETLDTRDYRQVVLAVGNDAQFRKLCEILGDPRIAEREKFRTNADRVKNRKELYRELNVHSLNFNRDELMDLLTKNQVPAGAVFNLEEVFSKPEASGMILEEKMEGINTKRVKTIAFNIIPNDPHN